MIMVPFVNAKLAGHPAWPGSLRRLRSAGVLIMDPWGGGLTGFVAIPPGTGASGFDRAWPLDRLATVDQRPR